MIITCPACTTRYHVGDSTVSNRARKVRCAKCAHEWVIDPVVGVTSPVMSVAARPRTEALAEPRLTAAEVEDVETDTGADIYRPMRPRMPSVDRIASIALALFVAAGLACAAWYYRVEIVRAWPPAAGLYGVLGIKVNVTGIEIRHVDWQTMRQNGMPVLTVNGDITNTTSRGVAVPRLLLTLRDDKERELYHWSVVLNVERLDPGQTARFSTTLQSPPIEANDVQIRLASGA
jgi:predicted Zn finger-like uncharacterized protein